MERDTEGMTYQDHARNLDFSIGRFLTPDDVPGNPADPQSWNRYSYVENDPINHVDPSGHKKSKKIKWPGDSSYDRAGILTDKANALSFRTAPSAMSEQ